MNARRRRLVLGTERIWGIWVWTIGMALGTLFAFGLARFTDGMFPPPTEPSEFSRRAVENLRLIVIIALIAALFVLRFHVWPPLIKLYKVAPRPEVFWGHVRAIGRRALPFSIVLALAVGQFVLPLGGYLVMGQVGLIFLIDHLIDRRRDRFITNEMPGFLPDGPEWADW